MNLKGNLKVKFIVSEIPRDLEHYINDWLKENYVEIETIIHDTANIIDNLPIHHCYIYYYDNQVPNRKDKA